MAADARAVFARFDLNGDGLIQADELKKVLQTLDADTFDDSTVDRLVAAWGSEDGCINYASFLEWVGGDARLFSLASKLRGIVFWADSDIHVTNSANHLKDAGMEVRAFSETADLLDAYAEEAAGKYRVLGIVSSTMESGGRKERGCMNAKELFAAIRNCAYASNRNPPVFGLISCSASPPEYWAAGADVISIGDRARVQELLLSKLLRQRNSTCAWEDMHVLWCDSNTNCMKMASHFEADGRKTTLTVFPGVEEMVSKVSEWSDADGTIAAIITSTMQSGGRKEAGLMDGFQGFAEVRRILEETSLRPLYAVVSGSSKTEDCYAKGADICICKDNSHRRNKGVGGGMWGEVAADIMETLHGLRSAHMEVEEVERSFAQTSADSFPSYWTSTGESFSEMVPLDNDDPLAVALAQVLQDCFIRKRPGDPSSPALATRDRGDGRETVDFKLSQAFRIEDAHMWKRYARCRHSLSNCTAFQDVAGPGGGIKTASTPGLPPVHEGCNEAFLFHGTNPEAAAGIVHTGFRLDFAGKAAGTAFGPGAYLAEASTKSDEYAKPGQGAFFGQMYAILLCRATLGEVVRVESFYYSDSETQRIVDEDIIRDKKFGCLLGDREAAVGTYREFIIFNKDQMYPEFVLLYRRDD